MTRSGLHWPETNPRSGPVSLRAFRFSDVPMVEEMATDPYVPLIGSLPAGADASAAAPPPGTPSAPSARGRGVATHALRALTAFGWTLPDLHRIELHVEPDNLASRHTAEHAGYQYEGVLRQHQEIGGRRRDMCLYAVLRDNPPSPSPGP